MFLQILPADQVAASPPNLMSVAITACVSVVVFWLGYRLNAASAQKERQRKVIEDWLRALSKWVDDFGDPSREADYSYNVLTSREIIELSLPRRQRYLAWWMHEMAVAVMKRRKAAGANLHSRQTCRSDLNKLLRETGGSLLKWHHRKLKSTDFHFPYQLRAQARKEKVDVRKYASARGLEAFVVPVRMNLRRQASLHRLLLVPVTGEPVIDSLRPFLRPKHLIPPMLFGSFRLVKTRVEMAHTGLQIHILKHRLKAARAMQAALQRYKASKRRK